MTDMPIRFSVFENEGGDPLSKNYWLDADGKLQWHTAANMVRGRYETVTVPHVDAFVDLITSGRYRQCNAVAFGIADAPSGFITTHRSIANGKARKGAIARDAVNFKFRAGEPGFLLLDCDPPAGRPHPTAYEIDRRLVKAAPWWEPLRRVYVSSGSAGIRNARGELVSRKTGWHCFAEIDDAGAAKAIGDDLVIRLIEQGDGYILISKSGALLPRSPIDRAVWQGERLVFCFGGVMGEGLTQTRDVVPMGGDVPRLETAGKGRTDYAEWEARSPIVRALKQDAKAEGEIVEKAHNEKLVEDAVARGVPRDKARHDYGRATRSGVLPAHMVLYAEDGQAVTVGEILADPQRWDRARFSDPLEPSYSNGDTVAVAFLLGQRVGPCLYSHAHGGQRHYRLMADESRVEQCKSALPGTCVEYIGDGNFEHTGDGDVLENIGDTGLLLDGSGWRGRNGNEYPFPVVATAEEPTTFATYGNAESAARVAADAPAPVAAEKPSKRKAKRGEHLRVIEGGGDAGNDPRPLVKLAAGWTHSIASRCEKHLVAADAPLFVRGTALVRPVVEVTTASDGRKTSTSALMEVRAVYLRDQLSRNIRFEKFDARCGDWVPADAPEDVAAFILCRAGEWTFRPIGGIVNAPTLRPDGSVLANPGYDPQTALFLHSDLSLPATMPDLPTRDDAQRALALLDELLADFPFVDPKEKNAGASKSVARSTLITPVVRGGIAAAPLHAMSAPTQGSGKSYVADIAASIALGHACPVIAATDNKEEMEKRLGAKALAGHPLFSLDNVNGELQSDILCQLVSQPIVEIRVLGYSTNLRVPNRHCILATGNNLIIRGDLTRRTLTCTLDARMERPFERTFRSRPVERVLAARGAYVAACLTIVRAYILAGRPMKLPPLASFEDWSDTVRAALVWLGCTDPAATVADAQDADPDRQARASVFAAMATDFGVGVKRFAKQILEAADAKVVLVGDSGQSHQTDEWRYPAIRDALGNLDARSSTKALGKWLSRNRDIPAGAYVLRAHEDERSNMLAWFVESLG